MNGGVTLDILPRAPVLELAIEPPAAAIELEISEGHSIDWYGGPYEATPSRSEQTLPTEDKTMRSDVTVRAIPYYETSNPYGTTYVIGE